jgi:hypothetical protein
MTGVEITEFLAARLDEREAAAKAGTRRVDAVPWRVDPEPWDGDTGIVDDYGRVGSTGGRYAAEHIALNDPASVLRDVAAKRRILAEIVPLITSLEERIIDEWGTPADEPYEYESLLKLLALPDSNHPDYDPAWALVSA